MAYYLRMIYLLSCDRRAVTALEYGLIAGLIVATIALGFGRLGSGVSTKFSTVGTSL